MTAGQETALKTHLLLERDSFEDVHVNAVVISECLGQNHVTLTDTHHG